MEADLVAGVVLLPVGVAALSLVRERREIPFASLPLLFAAHVSVLVVAHLYWRQADEIGAVDRERVDA